MYKAVALIPARSGSKRIKNKNIFKINQQPLLAYTINAAKKSKMFQRIICVTDNKFYASVAKKFGAEVPALRPKNISGDKSSDIEWLLWVMKEINGIDKFDLFSILRPTSPIRNSKTIKRAFNFFIKNKSYDSLRAVNKCKQHPAKMWLLKKKRLFPLLKNFKNNKIPTHSQQYANLPTVYVQNASLEIAWTRILKRKNPTISGNKILGFESVGLEGFDINNIQDIYLLKYLLQKKIVKLTL